MMMAASMFGDYFAKDLRSIDGSAWVGHKYLEVLNTFDSILEEDKFTSYNDLATIKDRIKSAIEIQSINQLSDKLEWILKKLGKESFMCPCTIQISLGDSHAILAEFEMSSVTPEDGDLNIKYDLIIYNTGLGTNYHLVCEECPSYKIQPFVVYKNIDLDALRDPIFLSAFLGLTMNQYDNNVFKIDEYPVSSLYKTKSASALYEVVLQNFGENKVQTSHVPPVFQRPQLSETCATSVIWAFLLKKYDTQVQKFKELKEDIQLTYMGGLIRKIDVSSSKLSVLNHWRLILEHVLSNIARHQKKQENSDQKEMRITQRNELLRLGIRKILQIERKMSSKPNTPATFGSRAFCGLLIKPVPQLNPLVRSKESFMFNTRYFSHLLDAAKKMKGDSGDPLRQLTHLGDTIRLIENLALQEDTMTYAMENYPPYEKQTRKYGQIMTTMLVNTVCIDQIDEYLVRKFKPTTNQSSYQSVLTNIGNLISYIKSEGYLTIPVIVALARLNYIGWRTACLWDERIFVPYQFGHPNSDIVFQANPDLFLKNYPFKFKILDELFEYRPRFKPPVASLKLLRDAVKLKKLFALDFIEPKSSQYQLEPLIDEKVLIFDPKLTESENPSLFKYGKAFFDSFPTLANERIKNEASRSYSELHMYIIDLIKKVGSNSTYNADDFQKIAPLFFSSFNQSPFHQIWPRTSSLAESPFAQLRLMFTLSNCQTTKDAARKALNTLPIYVVIEYDPSLPRGHPQNLEIKNTFKPKFDLAGLEKLNVYHLITRDPQSTNILCNYSPSSDETYATITKAHSSRGQSTKNSIRSKTINCNFQADPVIGWSEIWNHVDEGSLSLSDEVDSFWIHSSLFSVFKLSRVLGADNLPHQSILHALNVLNSIYRFSLMKFVQSLRHTKFDFVQLKRAGMTAYTQTVLLTMIQDQISSSVTLAEIYLDDFVQKIEAQRVKIEGFIGYLRHAEIECTSLGLFHASLLIIYDQNLGEKSATHTDQFLPILRNFIHFNLFLGPECFHLSFIMDHMADIYYRRLVEFLCIPKNYALGLSGLFEFSYDTYSSWKNLLSIDSDRFIKLSALINEILDNSYTVFEQPIPHGALWKPDDQPKYTKLLLSVENNKFNINIMSCQFSTNNWKTIRKFNTKEQVFDHTLARLLAPAIDTGSPRDDRTWYRLNKTIEVGACANLHETILRHEEEEFTFLMHWNTATPEDDIVTEFLWPFIFEPTNTSQEFFVWINAEKYLVIDVHGQLLYQVIKNNLQDNFFSRKQERSDYLVWRGRGDLMPIEIEEASSVGPENFIQKNFISRNTDLGAIFNRNFSCSIIGFKQRSGVKLSSTSFSPSPSDGYLLPSYRFDTADPSTCLVIFKKKKPSKARSIFFLSSSSSEATVEGWFVHHEMNFMIEEDQELRIGRNFIDHNFIIVSSAEKWYALVPINNERSFNPRDETLDGRFLLNHQDEPSLSKINRLATLEIERIDNPESPDGGGKISVLSASTRESLIFMAYYCLGKHLYPEALQNLKKISLTSEFEDEEMELLEMFFHMKEITKDSFPEAAAIRIYALYLTKTGIRVFNSCRKRGSHGNINPTKKWNICMSNLSEDQFLDDFETYFATENNLSPFFKIFTLERGEKNGILSYDQSIQCIFETLGKKSINRPHTIKFLNSKLKIATINTSYVPSSNQVRFEQEDLQKFILDSARPDTPVSEKDFLLINLVTPGISSYTLQSAAKLDQFRPFLLGLIKYCTDQATIDDFQLHRYAVQILHEPATHNPFLEPNWDLLTSEDYEIIEDFWKFIKLVETDRLENPHFSWSMIRQVMRDDHSPVSKSKLAALNAILNKAWPKESAFNKIHFLSGELLSDGSYLKYSIDNEIIYQISEDENDTLDHQDCRELLIQIKQDEQLAQELSSLIQTPTLTHEDQRHTEEIIETVKFQFEDPMFDELHADFIEEVKSGIEKFTIEYAIENCYTVNSEKFVDLIDRIKSQRDQYEAATKSINTEIMRTWQDGINLASYSNLLPERRGKPTWEEMFPILAKQTNFSVRHVFPGIQNEKINDIHRLIIRYAFFLTGMQHWDRILHLTSKMPVRGPILYRMSNLIRTEDWIDTPWIMAFEASTGVRLKGDQVNVLKSLGVKNDGDYEQKIVQRLMAYGKTFILGTCLALAKADGYHLSIIIPPASLFETNAKDMSARATQYFGQEASLIYYYRDENLEKESNILLAIISTMKRTIANRGFIIMTIETLQALMNRWILIKKELGEYSTKMDVQKPEILENQSNLLNNLNLLQFIFQIFGERGAALFDEIDMIFDPFKDLSFPLKSKQSVDKDIIEMIIHVIKCMANDEKFKMLTNIDIAKGNQFNFEYGEDSKRFIIRYTANWISQAMDISNYSAISKFLEEETEIELESRMQQLIQETLGITDCDSSSLIPLLGHNRKIKATSLDETDDKEVKSTPEFYSIYPYKIQKRTVEEFRHILSAAHVFIHSWLKRDLKSKVGVTMGPSLDRKYLFARPYLAANTPKENSEFSDKWQTIILTSLMYAKLGLNERLAEEWTSHLKEYTPSLDPNYMIDDQDANYSLSRSEIHFKFLTLARTVLQCPEISFEALFSPHRSDELKTVKSRLHGPNDFLAREIVFDFVKHKVFNNYRIQAEQVYSTTLDACAIFKTHQGYSGTIPNKYIFDHRVTANHRYLIDLNIGVNGMATYAILMAERKGQSHIFEIEDFTNGLQATDDTSAESSVEMKDIDSSTLQVPISKDSVNLVDDRLQKFFVNLRRKIKPSDWSRYTSLIDIGAEFKDFTTLSIARAILEHFGTQDGNRIECVIFFDEDSNNRMYLKRINGLFDTLKVLPPTPKGRTDIEKFTGMSINKIFVIYGQRHITGVDIEQPEDARAFATFSKDCNLRDLLQGIFRMRKLLSNQRVDFLVTRLFSFTIKRKLWELGGSRSRLDLERKLNLIDLITIASYYQYERARSENRTVVFQKIHSALKKYLIRGKLCNQDDDIFNAIYGMQTFVRSSSDNFWNNLRARNIEVEIHQLLDSYIDGLKVPFTTPEGINYFEQEAREIVKSYPNPDEIIKIKDSLNGILGREEGTLVQEVEVEFQIESILDENVYSGLKQLSLYKYPPRQEIPAPLEFISYMSCEECTSDLIKSLRSLIMDESGDLEDVANFFSPNIYATVNFYRTLSDMFKELSFNLRDRYRKDVFLVLVVPANETTPMKSILLSFFDANFILDNHMADIMGEKAAIFALSGICLVPYKFITKEDDDDSMSLFDIKQYVRNAQLLIDQGAETHLSQLALLAGNFEMLDKHRHTNLYRALYEHIKKRPKNFIAFMNDSEHNHFIDRKILEYKNSWLFELFLKLSSQDSMDDIYKEEIALEIIPFSDSQFNCFARYAEKTADKVVIKNDDDHGNIDTSDDDDCLTNLIEFDVLS